MCYLLWLGLGRAFVAKDANDFFLLGAGSAQSSHGADLQAVRLVGADVHVDLATAVGQLDAGFGVSDNGANVRICDIREERAVDANELEPHEGVDLAGQIDTFMGFKFVRVNSAFFPYVANTDVRTIVAYAKSGIKLADSGRKVHMDIRTDKSHSLQIRTVAALGATRTQEKKVVRILCDESPA